MEIYNENVFDLLAPASREDVRQRQTLPLYPPSPPPPFQSTRAARVIPLFCSAPGRAQRNEGGTGEGEEDEDDEEEEDDEEDEEEVVVVVVEDEGEALPLR